MRGIEEIEMVRAAMHLLKNSHLRNWVAKVRKEIRHQLEVNGK